MAGTPFLDLTDALDRDEPISIDFCHVSPNGNEMDPFFPSLLAASHGLWK